MNRYSSKERGIYLANLSNKKMSNDQYKFLNKNFDIPKDKLKELRKDGKTLCTTNNIDKHKKYLNLHKQLY
ncbi:hypothetical protein, partial [Escherichia coli]|uniref:hypothetical protein n=1 Tax=Escherichia coli TaxID=562 RepID=UPI001AD89E8E